MTDMDYTAAQDAFFQPRDAAAPPQTGPPSAARALRDAMEAIATISFWARPVYDRLEAFGLNFLTGYVWGRGSALGAPDGRVVAAAFGAFEPGLITTLYDEARGHCTHAQIRQALSDGVVEALTDVLGNDAAVTQDVTDAVATLRRGVDATDGFGRALTAGLLAQPWPTEPLAELWHACAILREFRGDNHLAACVTAGLDGPTSNILTERMIGWEPLAYTATRGWSPEVMQAGTDRLVAQGRLEGSGLSAAGTEFRHGIEQITERSMTGVVAAIGDDLDALVHRLDGWSQAIIERGWFPPDPYKRAAG